MNAVSIIMRNENCTEKEAEQIWNNCRHDVMQYVIEGDYTGAEDCLLSYGLDLDFMMNII